MLYRRILGGNLVTLRTARGLRTVAAVSSIIMTTLVLTNPAQAFADPILGASSIHQPTNIIAGTYAKYTITVSNSGDSETGSPVSVEFIAPAGTHVTKVEGGVLGSISPWDCGIAPEGAAATCIGPDSGGSTAIGPGEEACVGPLGATCRIVFILKAEKTLQSGAVTPVVEACGGGAATCVVTTDPTVVSPDFYIKNFDAYVFEQDGKPALVAGSHPFGASLSYTLSIAGMVDGRLLPYGAQKDVKVDLPAGLIANPNVVDTCSAARFGAGLEGECPDSSQVGLAYLHLLPTPDESLDIPVPVYNVERTPGTAALFAMNFSGLRVYIVGRVRTGGDYGITTEVKNTPQIYPVSGVDFTLWGTPASAAFDYVRGACLGGAGQGLCPSSLPPTPMLTLPTSCRGHQRTDIAISTWERGSATASVFAHDIAFPEPSLTSVIGCDAVKFSPTLEGRPTTNIADSPTGLNGALHLPQNQDPEGTAEAHLKEAVVRLPGGLVINPAVANGLASCSLAEVDLDGPRPAQCPPASKLGRVELDAPPLAGPLLGSVYLAKPYDNPFDSLLALYVAVDDKERGIVVKLAGEVELDPQTGRLAIRFEENPQLPFEDLKLSIDGGAAAPLRTPETCGTYAVTSSITPWSAPASGPPATPADTFAIEHQPGGAACPGSEGRPERAVLDAGTVHPIAGGASPLVVNLLREDGTEQISGLSLALPPGLVGRLAGVPECSDVALAAAAAKGAREESTDPSCPLGSRIGGVQIGGGAGPTPYYIDGSLYLAGPHAGAERSVAAVVPVQAGPFDLGTVVVHIAVDFDPATGQLHLATDLFPRILAGIPLDLRQVSLSIDRPGLIRNPTNCEPMSINGYVTYRDGSTAPVTNRFQVGDCAALRFKPRVSLQIFDGLARNAHPALRAAVHSDPGQAGLADIAVTLPTGELLDLRGVRALCARELSPERCPRNSRLGHARLFSPLLPEVLRGPIYMRAPGHRYPDLLAELRADGFDVLLHGHTAAAPGGRLRVRFTGLPDLPLTRASFTLDGGRHGIFVNSESLCARPRHATVGLSAHNGKQRSLRPKVRLRGSC